MNETIVTAAECSAIHHGYISHVSCLCAQKFLLKLTNKEQANSYGEKLQIKVVFLSIFQ